MTAFHFCSNLVEFLRATPEFNGVLILYSEGFLGKMTCQLRPRVYLDLATNVHELRLIMQQALGVSP